MLFWRKRKSVDSIIKGFDKIRRQLNTSAALAAEGRAKATAQIEELEAKRTYLEQENERADAIAHNLAKLLVTPKTLNHNKSEAICSPNAPHAETECLCLLR